MFRRRGDFHGRGDILREGAEHSVAGCANHMMMNIVWLGTEHSVAERTKHIHRRLMFFITAFALGRVVTPSLISSVVMVHAPRRPLQIFHSRGTSDMDASVP